MSQIKTESIFNAQIERKWTNGLNKSSLVLQWRLAEVNRSSVQCLTVQNQTALYWPRPNRLDDDDETLCNWLTGWPGEPDWFHSHTGNLTTDKCDRQLFCGSACSEKWKTGIKIVASGRTGGYTETFTRTDSDMNSLWDPQNTLMVLVKKTVLESVIYLSPLYVCLSLQALSQRDPPHRNFFFFDGRKGNGVVDFFGPN